jgi:protein-disulfide isomerase
MASKRRRKTKGRSSRQQGRQSSSRMYLLLAGVAVVAVVAVGLIILLDQGSGRSSGESGGVAPEKSLGAADAPVVVVEYGDFQCPYCKQFATGPEQQLRKEYVDAGTVRFVYRHLAFLGDESTWAAEASECANAQGRFWDYHDKLFEEQAGENQGAFKKDNLKRFAADLGLDTERFNQCLDSGEYRALVREESQAAQRRRINSTPSILVNEQLIPNGANYGVMQRAIEAALAQP